ncbi:hypothetical protein Tco_1190255 [Tanacetum coccineum]
MTSSYCPFEQPGVSLVISPTNKFLQVPHHSSIIKLLVGRLDHDARPFPVLFTLSSLWQVLHPQVGSNIMKNISDRIERPVTKLVEFI